MKTTVTSLHIKIEGSPVEAVTYDCYGETIFWSVKFAHVAEEHTQIKSVTFTTENKVHISTRMFAGGIHGYVTYDRMGKVISARAGKKGINKAMSAKLGKAAAGALSALEIESAITAASAATEQARDALAALIGK